MEIQSELELRKKLLEFLKDEISLEQFEDWLVPRSWNFHQSASRGVQSLVADIELALAEFSNGDWTKEELKTQLAQIAQTYKGEIAFDSKAQQVTTATSGSAFPQSGSWSLFDIRLSMVFESQGHRSA